MNHIYLAETDDKVVYEIYTDFWYPVGRYIWREGQRLQIIKMVK